jgi:hypothetical protein
VDRSPASCWHRRTQAFGQICSLAARPSPASYFRESRVPADIIADALNFNLRFTRDVEDVGVLATMGDEDNGLGVPTGSELRAATGPAYGRIWDADIVDAGRAAPATSSTSPRPLRTSANSPS